MRRLKSKQIKIKPIAIIGLGVLFPSSKNAEEFWKNILQKKDLITEVPPNYWLLKDYYDPDPKATDKTYCKRGGFLGPSTFDPLEFGIPPSILAATDSTQLLALLVTKQALNSATGGDYRHLDLSRAGVILGITCGQQLAFEMSNRLSKPVWEKALGQHGIEKEMAKKICDTATSTYLPWQESTFPGLLSNVVAGRIANRFNFGGTNCVIDAACASSLSSVAAAFNELNLGEINLAVSGGADTLNDPFTYLCFSKTPALSISGDCRPFSDKADGTLLGEGIGLFVLKRLEDAEHDGDSIYAVIRGIGSSSDGRHTSIYAPVAEGQSRAILRAYEMADFTADSVELVEAHGTGTKAGDMAEVNGLRKAFAQSNGHHRETCALGSIKSQIGHTKGAAGAAALFKVVMALHHKVLPPTIKVDKPNPKLNLQESPFYLNTEVRPWIHSSQSPRRAGVSAFGFGGSNFHLALEEYTGPGKHPSLLPTWSTELITLTANKVDPLYRQCQEIVNSTNNCSLTFIARESQSNVKQNQKFQIAIVAHSLDDLKKKLNQIMFHIKNKPDKMLLHQIDTYYSIRHEKNKVKIACLFPGQGSQYLNMAKDMTTNFSCAREIWDEAVSTKSDINTKLHTIVYPVPSFDDTNTIKQKNDLNQSRNANPAIVISSLVFISLLKKLNLKIDHFEGLGLGELGASFSTDNFDMTTLLNLALNYNDQSKDDQAEIFKKLIDKMYQDGVRIFIDVGPNTLLTTLIEQQLADKFKTIQVINLDDPRNDGIINFWRALAQLFTAGVPINFTSLWADFSVEEPPKITHHKSHSVDITGTCYGKLYPSKEDISAQSKSIPVASHTFIQNEAIPIMRGEIKMSDKKSKLGSDAPAERGNLAINKNYKKIADNSIGTNEEKAPQVMDNEEEIQPSNDPVLLQLFDRFQQQTVEAHNTYQKTMLKSHLAFLKTVETIFSSLSTSHPKKNVSRPPNISAKVMPIRQSDKKPPNISTLATPSKPITAADFKATETTPERELTADNKSSSPSPASISQVIPPSRSVHTPKTLIEGAQIAELLLNSIAEKTGYPADMLNLDMSLESDLGIDSIKRVEILAGIQENLPELPDTDPSEIASLNTLQEIVNYIEKSQNKMIEDASEKKKSS
ncbi:MAG: hypothetical protein H0U71_03065 [Gammaproteobacteria bacterium]|nr:hypothetical protein [Gammaproteobacteria bacterium]